MATWALFPLFVAVEHQPSHAARARRARGRRARRHAARWRPRRQRGHQWPQYSSWMKVSCTLPLADPCAHSRISFICASSATRLRCLHFSHSFLPTTRELTLPCIDMLAEACWQVGKSSASCCLPPRSTARCAHHRCGHRVQDGRDLLHAGPPSGVPERLY